MNCLPIEDAWRVMADGLHVHRYFLGAHGRRLHAEQTAYDTFAERHRTASLPTLDELRQRLRGGVLEHLLHRSQPDAASVMAAFESYAPPSHLGDTPVLLASADDCLDTDGPVVAALAMRQCSSRPFDQSFLDEAIRGVAKAGLLYLIEIAVDVVVVAPRVHVRSPEGPSATAIVERTEHPLALGEALVGAAGRELLDLFLGESGAPTGDPDRKLIAGALAASMRHRYLGAVFAADPPAIRSQGLLGRFGTLTRRLEDDAEAVLAAADRFGTEVFDLVSTNLPGPRQFEKYLSGMGPGQS